MWEKKDKEDKEESMIMESLYKAAKALCEKFEAGQKEQEWCKCPHCRGKAFRIYKSHINNSHQCSSCQKIFNPDPKPQEVEYYIAEVSSSNDKIVIVVKDTRNVRHTTILNPKQIADMCCNGG